MRLASSLLAILSLTASSALAQESRATIIGRTIDPTGALVAGATVKAANTATNITANSVTNEGGNFEIPYLLPGLYRVTVEMTGFKRAVRDKIELRVNDRMMLDFTLELGDVAESVVVTGETPMLETANASIGLIMDERRVAELPVVGGNPFYLSRLTPGVLSSGGRSAGNPMDNGAATGVIVNGTRGGSSEVMVDGSPNMTNRNAVFSPPQDLVQEFKIQTATYDASIGHAAGAMTNVSMKSGSNALHGTGYYNDSRHRAIPWFTNRFLADPRNNLTPEERARQIPSWLHRRWGATMTGPVWIPKAYDGRNKTFWTFGFEDLEIVRNLSFTGTVPTEAQRRGDFSALLALGSRYQIYDPFTIAAAPNGRFSRQPLPGNIVPSSRIDPVAARIISFYPMPNQPNLNVEQRDNFFHTRNILRENYTYTSRVDHSFGEKNRFFLRWNNSQHDNSENAMGTITNHDLLDRTGWGIVADDVHVINPGLLLNVRYGISYQSDINNRGSQGFDLLSLGFPSRLVNEIVSKLGPNGIAFPNVQVDGGAYTALSNNGGSSAGTNYHTASATLTRIAGSHSMRWGTEYRLMRETGFNFGSVAPQLIFGNGFTRGPLDNSPASPIGQGMASMLFGIATSGTINNNASRAEESSYIGFYFQDDWRLTSKLTVNLGLRWEYETPITERYNRSIRDFDFSTASPISQRVLANYARSPIPEVAASSFRTMGGLRFAGMGGQPNGLWRGDRNNFAPRAGLAYQLNRKTVIRAGYGIFFDVVGVDRNGVNQGGFNQPTNLIPTLDNGLTYVATLRNPFPNGIEDAQGASGGLNTFLGRSVSFFNDRPLNPYMQRWSFSIQRQLPSRIVADISYVGNRGTKLPVSTEMNPIPRQYLSTSASRDQTTIDFLSRQVNSPFFGMAEFAGTGLANQRVGVAQLLRPFPHFGDITATLPAGYSYYHSLQVAVEKRMSDGLTFQSSWTWSKFMEGTGYLNDTDPFLEKVISDQDFTHRFVISTIWEVPVGRNRKWLANMRPIADHIAGGWQLQGWYEGQTGQALGFGNAIFTGNLQDIELPVSERRAERWFNVDAGFNRNPQQVLANNLRGLNSRFNGVRSDGINNWDLSLFKNFRVREGVTAQFRIENYNALNHVQFANPNTNPVSAAFGTITGEKGHGQRQLTFGIKLMF
ncbi:MAG: carboxypeptidase regulatory-like domain-containing protein [Acidimicrobiia bacterium]|nr:carboxypeptidase regulatory-like domain-containing protein [Acidimicrobiia bacterium]